MSEKTIAAASPRKKYLNEAFVEGGVNGLNIALFRMLPNMVMAYVIIKILNLTGLLNIIGTACAPVMAIFGLPGEAAMVVVGAWLSASGGTGTAVSLFTAGVLTGSHLAILSPCIVLVGGQMQYLGRLLAVCGIRPERWGLMILFSFINGFIAMLIMNLLLGFF